MERSFDVHSVNNIFKPEYYYTCESWKGYELYDHEYSYEEIDNFFDEVLDYLNSQAEQGYPIFDKFDKKEIYNIPCSFDIEASSFRDAGTNQKAACMYIWQFGFNGSVIYGRTWDQFFDFLEQIVAVLGLSKKRMLYIYVHNLSYEFQWIKKFFEWDDVFALKKRKVAKAIFEAMGLEFRCSYLLANAGLAHVGEKMLTKYKVKKLVGNLDYSQVRSSSTSLTKEEIDYAMNDVRVVMSLIQEKIENEGGISHLPLTNTGYVRNRIRSVCMPDQYNSQKYHQVMNSLTIDSEEEYDQNKRALMGGFTHTGIKHANKTRENVDGADIASSYPFQMVTNYFPMSKAKYIGAPKSLEQFIDYLNSYCCIFDVEFHNLLPAVDYENYLSIHKCIAEDFTLNNGRIVSAKHCLCTLTEIDFDIVNRMYNWSSMSISNLRIYTRGYLPKPIITSVLELYSNKTKLKDVPGEVVEYLRSKNMTNSSFGMMLTDIVRPTYALNNDYEWYSEEAFKQKQLNSYNKSFNRFLYYTWGIYVTAHARHRLFEAIWEFGDDYIYADTDSVKGTNFEKHREFFEISNFKVEMALKKVCRIMDIDFSLVSPKTIYGDEKMLGVWEFDSHYLAFKACGAKRYMYINPPDKEHSEPYLGLTVAGLNKNTAIPYLMKNFDGDLKKILDNFHDGFTVPPGHAGKQTVTYIDVETQGYAYDYLNSRFEYHEASSVHMEPQGFSMSQTDEYLKMIKGITEDERR